MKKTGHGSYNLSTVCLIVCGLYYACGSLDSGTIAPTPTPMSRDTLPLFTLNCSLLDKVWGTLDWTGSGVAVGHTYIEVVCLHGGEKRKYYGEYWPNPLVQSITPSIPPINIIHISSSTPNMCTAALWESSVDDHNPTSSSTIVLGPSFTSCALPITSETMSVLQASSYVTAEPYSSPLLSNPPLPTVTEPYSSPLLSSSPLQNVTDPVDDAIIIVSATVPSVTILVLVIFGSVLIATIFIGKKRRKSSGKKTLDKETLELKEVQSSYFLENGHCDKETVYDTLSEINLNYHVDDSHNYIDQNDLTINFTKPEVHEEIPAAFPGYKVLGDFLPNSDQFQSDPINETINMDEMSDTSSKFESDTLLNDFQLRQFLNESNSENINSDIPGYVPLRVDAANMHVL